MKIETPIQKCQKFVSKVFFLWIYPILWGGFNSPESLQKLSRHLPVSDSADVQVKKFEKVWNEELKSSNPSLISALAKVFGTKYFLLGLSALVEECVIKIGQPILLGLVLQSFRSGTESNGWPIAIGLIGLSVWYVIQHPPLFFEIQHTGMRIRVALSGLIFKQALKMSGNQSQTSSGQLTNIMGNDVSRLDLSKDFLHYLWIAPIQLVIATAILWLHFDWVALMGMAFLMMFIPLQSVMGKAFGKLRAKVSVKTDRRLKAINEALGGIFSIKMQSWEEYFEKRINDARRKEYVSLTYMCHLRAVNLALSFVTCKVVLFIMLLIYVLLGNFLTPEKVFLASSLLNNVRMTLTLNLPFAVAQLAESKVAVKRIQEFLLSASKESNSGPDAIQVSETDKQDLVVELSSVSASWEKESPVFEGLNLSLKRGEFVGIMGSVGSGKTTLLKAVMREAPVCGNVKIRGTLAYVPQEPWIFCGTIKDNILFGQEFDATKYSQVIKDCCLDQDISRLPGGDEVWLEDGGTLSGGQRARISLARALYTEAEILLVDDILSAVDSKVGQQLLIAIESFASKKGSVLFASSQPSQLRNADYILKTEMGKTPEQCTADSLPEMEHEKKDKTVDDVIEERDNQEEEEEIGENLPTKTRSATEEFVSFKEIPFSVYTKYITAGGGTFLLTVAVLSNLFAQGLFTGTDYWLKVWSKLQRVPNVYDTSNGLLEDHDFQLLLYTGLIMALLVFTFLRSTAMFLICLRAANAIHGKMTKAVLSTKLLFFQQNPIGRILNRFTKDFQVMDDSLPILLFDTIEVGLQVFGVLIIVAVIKPVLLLPAIFVCSGFYGIRKLYLASAQTLKRIEGNARSPYLTHLQQCTQPEALLTIRAARMEEFVTQKFYSQLDFHTNTCYVNVASSRWLGMNLDWIALTYFIIVVIVVMTTKIAEEDAGLVITSAMTLVGIMQWCVKQSSETANQMVSVERALEYADLESEEAETVYEEGKANWCPMEGKIEFKDLSFRHEPEGVDVLKELSFVVTPESKVGIAGRTGAGKSSLIAAIMRVQSPSSGAIMIDGVDHKLIPLERLRRSINYVPQNAFMFEGTIRENLDPLELYDEPAKCRILDLLKIKEKINLDFVVEEGGSNLSSGEQQLICLGRALLAHSKILILDEATSSVDRDVETIMQEAIKKCCNDSTVLFIAHRIHTLLTAEKVLILGNGQVLEYGTKESLLEDKESYLYNLINSNSNS